MIAKLAGLATAAALTASLSACGGATTTTPVAQSAPTVGAQSTMDYCGYVSHALETLSMDMDSFNETVQMAQIAGSSMAPITAAAKSFAVQATDTGNMIASESTIHVDPTIAAGAQRLATAAKAFAATNMRDRQAMAYAIHAMVTPTPAFNAACSAYSANHLPVN